MRRFQRAANVTAILACVAWATAGVARADVFTFDVDLDLCPYDVAHTVEGVTVKVLSLDEFRPEMTNYTDASGVVAFVLAEPNPPETIRIQWLDATTWHHIDLEVVAGDGADPGNDYEFETGGPTSGEPCGETLHRDGVIIRTNELPLR